MRIVGPEKPPLDELYHYGVRGMKWGVRRGSLGSRLKGGLADRNQRETAVLRRARSGKTWGVNEKINRGIGIATSLGKKRFNEKMDKQIAERKAQARRLKSGKLKARDILETAFMTGPFDLFVSVRDNRG